MNYHKIEKNSIANGTGVRVVLWVSGCSIHCKGCQNPETWDFNSGMPFDHDAVKELLQALDKPYIQGLTLSGGHPLDYDNLIDVYDIITLVRETMPQKDIWLYTGCTLNIRDFDTSVNVCWDNGLLRNYILANCDVVVDGPYIEEQRDITLPWRGSRNQRVIDVKETIKQGEIVLWK